MPRIRTLKPESLQHRKVGRLSDRAFRLWVALITQSDDHGRLLFDADQFRVLAWGYHANVKTDDVNKALREITQRGLFRTWIAVDGQEYGYFPSWSDHQRVQHPSPSMVPDPPFHKDAITGDIRVALAERHGGKPGESVPIKCHYCDATSSLTWHLNSRGQPSMWVTFGGFEMDHVVPESAGGPTTPENIVLSCQRCNRSKSTLSVERSGTFMNKVVGSEGIGKDQGSEGIKDQESASLFATPSDTPTNGHFKIPAVILDALKRAPKLGTVDGAAFWQAELRANPGVDYPTEILKAEAWMTAHPERRYKKLSGFLHNWLARADQEEMPT